MLSGTIGSGTRDSTKTNAANEHEAEHDETTDAEVGPVGRLGVGESHQDGHEGRREERGADVVDARTLSPPRWYVGR